ncbi:hypothetical protein Dimus_021488 [Dionaea muscipula]
MLSFLYLYCRFLRACSIRLPSILFDFYVIEYAILLPFCCLGSEKCIIILQLFLLYVKIEEHRTGGIAHIQRWLLLEVEKQIMQHQNFVVQGWEQDANFMFRSSI